MMDRDAILQRLRSGELFDLLVIGGGATGCGVALDAASRGLKVALCEKGDFGSGTSGKSTKLIHGGIRYLEKALLNFDRVQFNLVRDALSERSILLRIAPHLCHRLPLIIPCYSYLEFPYFLSGLKIYDLLAGQATLGASMIVSRDEIQKRFPTLKREGLIGGVLFYDGQFNDARMNIALALTANEHGAAAASYLDVIGLLKEGGRVAGARVRDQVTGGEWEIAARCVINACGPCCDELRRLDDPDAVPLLQGSSGIHVVVGAGVAPAGAGLVIPKTEDGRVLFVLPWLGGSLIGTTDRPALSCQDPQAAEEDIDYLLRHLNRYLDAALSRNDLSAAWAGVRPLVRDASTADTASLARDDIIHESPSALVTITGGKWTAYRRMARDTVDFVTGRIGQRGECRTDSIPLHGAERFHAGAVRALAEKYGVERDVAVHLHRNYGDRAEEVAALCQRDLGERLAPGHPYLKGEVLYAVRRELALYPIDFLARRIPLALLDAAAAKGAAATVLESMARELGWDEETASRVSRDTTEALRGFAPPDLHQDQLLRK